MASTDVIGFGKFNTQVNIARPERSDLLAWGNKVLNGELSTKQVALQLGLNAQQYAFCQAYTDPDVFGNSAEAHKRAYGEQDSDGDEYTYDSHKTMGYRLLRNSKINDMLAVLLHVEGLNDNSVDRALLELINQREDKRVRLAALREYNLLHGRLKATIEHVHRNELDLTKLSTEEISSIVSILSRVEQNNTPTEDAEWSEVPDEAQ